MRRLPAFMALLLLAACQSQVPIATTYEMTFQQKMQAAHHWQVLAEDIVEQVALRGEAHQGPIVIEREGPPTTFAIAFDDMLVTAFVERGFVVRAVPDAESVVLRYKTQVISHNSDAFVRPPPGTFAVLTAGVLAVRQVAIGDWGSSGAIAGLAVAAAGAELVSGSITETTRTEIIVTTSLLRGETYIARFTDIYYLPDDDVALYADAGPATTVAAFVVTYDSWVRSLSDVRAEANERCQRDGRWAMLIGRDIAQRMHRAEFRCYVP